MTAVVVCALCAAAFGALLKKTGREHALLLTTGAAALLLLRALESTAPLVTQLREGVGPQGLEYLQIMVKAVGIALLGQFAMSACKDAGENALAFGVSLCTKAAILTAALPLLTQLLGYVGEILQL